MLSRNLLVLLDRQRRYACRQRLENGLNGRCGGSYGSRRHRLLASTAGKSRKGKKNWHEFHEAGVRQEVWRNRGGRQAHGASFVNIPGRDQT